jgi:hypothetical protein
MESKGLAKLLKRVNERICALRADSLDTEAAFFCECGWRDCTEPIQLTPRAYLLRTGLFLLAPGHESPRVALPLPWWSVRRPSQGSRDDVTLSRSSIPGVEK